MNIAIILESLKFYKLKHAKTVQLWFLLLYALNILVYILPFSDSDFTALINFTSDTSRSNLPTDQYLIGVISTITQGNWIMIGLSVLVYLIGLFFSLMYATLMISEKQGLRPRQALAACLVALPRLLVIVLAIMVIAALSISLFFIPAIIIVTMLFFAPLAMTLDKMPMMTAIRQSYENTMRRKLLIVSQVLMLWAIVTLPSNLILGFISGGPIPYAMVASFFTVLGALMQGRLMGLLYVILVKNDQTVVPSESDKQP